MSSGGVAGRLLSLILGLIIACFAVEILLRCFLPQQLIQLQDDIWIADSSVGWKTRPLLNTRVNTGDKEVHLYTDEEGFRVNMPGQSSRRYADIALLILGDSFVHGFEVENEETIPEQLAKKLAEEYNIRAIGVNAGVRGYNPGQYFLSARKALSLRKYDAGVVCLWAGDDCFAGIDTIFAPYHIRQHHRLKMPQRLNWRGIIEAWLYPVNDFLESHSHLYIFFKTRLEGLLARMGLTAKTFPEVFDKREANSSRWEDTALTCYFIQQEFERYNTPVLFVLLPTVFQVYEKAFHQYTSWLSIPADSVDIALPNRMLPPAMAEKGLIFADVTEYMKSRALKGERLFCRVDVHFSAEGCKAAAEGMYPHLVSILKGKLEEGTSAE